LNNKHKYNQNIVLHDIFDIRGGGERLALSLVNGLKSDLAFGKHSAQSFRLEKLDIDKIYDLGLKLEFPGLKTLSLSNLFGHNTHFLKHYDKVIYSGMICPLAIQNHLMGGNYYYCHTPPRFVYDKFDYYLKQNYLPQRIMMRLLVLWFKPRYEESVALMDVIMANSEFVKARIKKHLNRDAVVVHPPCKINQFNFNQSQGYYLSTARFDVLKRVDLVIQAFKEMPDKNLVVCSAGSEEAKLKKLATGCQNISFTGQVSDNKLSELISHCIATIYIPKDEDFGMSPVESMAAGKPVICSDHGGPTESVIDEETGYYIDDSNICYSLIEAVNKLDTNQAAKMRSACEQRSLKFSEESFHDQVKKYVLD
jgi:glycosyltransferase involved in cell wall biosynthesis